MTSTASCVPGAGHLSIDGSGLLEAGGWTPNELIVTGESFEMVRLPEVVITVSPDVTVNAVGESLEVNGRVVIPRARITPPEITEGAVSVSSDEVLVGRTENVSQPKAGRGPDVAADLAVVLGDDVVFDGFGLTSRLTGDLRVRRTPGGVPAAFGALDLVDGQLMVYGQRLNMEHGRVTFAGALNDPSSRVHPEPPLGETEAFSLLLTGHTLSSANQRTAPICRNMFRSTGLSDSHPSRSSPHPSRLPVENRLPCNPRFSSWAATAFGRESGVRADHGIVFRYDGSSSRRKGTPICP